MSEQVKIAFEKWYNRYYAICEVDTKRQDSCEEAWDAATAEANKRMVELEAKVSELDGMLGKRNLHKEHEYLQRMKELQARNNTLREALGKIKVINDKYIKNGHIDHIVDNSIYSTPAESLQAHDDEVIEKAFTPTEKVIVAIENEVQSQLVASGINEVMHRLDGQYIFNAAIRALKEVK